MSLLRGHLYWASLDKRRPVLVISPNYRNEHASDVIVIPCTTTLRVAPTHVELRAKEGGVPARSVLKCEQILTLLRSDLEMASLGRSLSASRIIEVERAVMRAIGIPMPIA